MSIHPVAAAIEPLRQSAIEMGRQSAESLIDSIEKKLAEHGMDFNKAFPYPRHDASRMQYMIAKQIMAEAASITRRVGVMSYMPNSPRFVEMDREACARFVKLHEEMAAASYEAFVAKLVQKIGACDTAALDSRYGVWENSIVTVTKDATVERWSTQMIVNRSALGKLFNQWPTRKLKR